MKRKLEHRYLNLYKQYKKGRITTAGFTEACEDFHYQDSKSHLYRISPQGVWFQYKDDQWHFSSHLTLGWHRRRLNVLAGYTKPHYVLKGIAWMMVVLLVLTLVFPETVPSIKGSISAYRERQNTYVSKKQKIELTDEITMMAPEGALYEGQTFSAYSVDLDEAGKILEENDVSIVPVYAMEFDGGLAPEESFMKAVTLSVDLDAMDVPGEAYDQLVAVRIRDDGFVEQLHTEIDGKEILVHTNGNTLIEIGIAVLIGGGLVIDRINNAQRYGSAMFDGYDYASFKISKYGMYTVWYKPEDYKVDNFFKYYLKQMDPVMNKYGLKWYPNRKMYDLVDNTLVGKVRVDTRNKAIRDVLQDSEYIKIKNEFINRPIPEEVENVMAAIRLGHDYLYDKRNFKRVSTHLDVIIQGANYGGGTAEAVYNAKNLDWNYIAVNKDKLRDINPLNVTMAHEMFHAIQTEYYRGGLTVFSQDKMTLQFDEASAMVLEMEAAAAYKDKTYENRGELVQWAKQFHLGWKEAKRDASKHQDYGYGLGVILTIQKASYGKNSDQYLHDLLMKRSEVWNVESIQSLNKSEMFLEYMKTVDGLLTSQSLVMNDVKVLSEDNVMSFTFEDKQLSIEKHAFRFADSDFSSGYAKDHAVFLHYIDASAAAALDGMERHMIYDIQGSSGNQVSFREVPGDYGFYVVPVDSITGKMKSNERIHELILMDERGDDYVIQKAEVKSLLAIPPEKPAEITYDEDTLKFKIRLENDLNSYKELVKGRMVELEVPGTSIKPYRVYFPVGTDEKEVHLMDLLLSEGYDTDRIGDKVMDRMLEGMIQNNIRLMTNQFTAATDGMLISYWDSDQKKMNLRINENYRIEEATEAFKNPYQAVKKMSPLPTYLDIYVKSKDQDLSVTLETENKAYLTASYNRNQVFNYLRYTLSDANAGMDFDKALKRLKELDGSKELTCTARRVYSTEDDAESYLFAEVCEEIYHQSTPLTVLGPVSEETIVPSPNPTNLPTTLPARVYRGGMIVKMSTNMDKAIPSMLQASQGKRLEVLHSAGMERYKTEQSDYLQQVRAKEGETGVQVKLNEESKKIKEDFYEDDKEFNEDFEKDFMSIINAFNGLSYTFEAPENMSGKAVLTITDTIGKGKGDKDHTETMVGTLSTSGKSGVYTFVIQGNEPLKVVMTPSGKLIISGIPSVLK